MRAFMGESEWEDLHQRVELCVLLPKDGPRYGIPEDVLWLMNAFTLHLKDPEEVRKDQWEVLNLIRRGADLEDVWPTYAVHLLNLYNDSHVSYCQRNKFDIPEHVWKVITELRQIASDREKMYRPHDHRHTLGRIKMTPGKEPFWRAFFEAVMENRPANPYLAVCAFRNDPATTMSDWARAEQLFRSTLVTVGEGSLPKEPVFLVAGRRPVRLRGATEVV